MGIGERIRKKRKEKKLTQTELSNLVNVSSQVISNWERGYTDPNHNDVARLSEALEVSSEYLLGRKSIDSIQENKLPDLTEKDQKDIAKKLESILGELENESGLAFNGEPMDETTRDLVKAQIESNLQIAKKIAKKKFTSKKYRKDDE